MFIFILSTGSCTLELAECHFMYPYTCAVFQVFQAGSRVMLHFKACTESISLTVAHYLESLHESFLGSETFAVDNSNLCSASVTIVSF